MKTIKLHEARYIISNGKKLGKRILRWEVPTELMRIKKNNINKALVGIEKWRNTNQIYACLIQKEEIIFIEKKVWLEITKSLKRIK